MESSPHSSSISAFAHSRQASASSPADQSVAKEIGSSWASKTPFTAAWNKAKPARAEAAATEGIAARARALNDRLVAGPSAVTARAVIEDVHKRSVNDASEVARTAAFTGTSAADAVATIKSAEKTKGLGSSAGAVARLALFAAEPLPTAVTRFKSVIAELGRSPGEDVGLAAIAGRRSPAEAVKVFREVKAQTKSTELAVSAVASGRSLADVREVIARTAAAGLGRGVTRELTNAALVSGLPPAVALDTFNAVMALRKAEGGGAQQLALASVLAGRTPAQATEVISAMRAAKASFDLTRAALFSGRPAAEASAAARFAKGLSIESQLDVVVGSGQPTNRRAALNFQGLLERERLEAESSEAAQAQLNAAIAAATQD